MKQEEWSLIVALISAVGAIGSAIFAYQQKQIANQAKDVAMKQTKIAEESKEASLRSAEAAETSSKTAEEAVGEGFRPYVIVKMYTLDLSLDIEIINIGNRPAKDIIIEVNPGFENLIELEIFKGMISGINRMFNHKYLAPNQPIKTSILMSSDYLNKFDELVNDVRTFCVKYKSLEDVSYQLEYQIDIRDFLIREKIASISDTKHLKDIEAQIKDLNKNLKNLNKP